MEDCPDKGKPAKLCFNCGSTEHALWDCPQPKVNGTLLGTSLVCEWCTEWLTIRLWSVPPGNLSSSEGCTFAQCFVCGQQGHLSSRCPQNEKGLYPKGGGCYR